MVNKKKWGRSLSPQVYNQIEPHIKDGNFLEIGTYQGISISNLADKFPNTIFYVIDPFIADGHTGETLGVNLTLPREFALKNFENRKNIILFEMTSRQFLDLYKDSLDDFGIKYVMVDGSHHYDDVMVDCEIVESIKGLKFVVFDDLLIPDVLRAVRDFGEKFKNKIRRVYSSNFSMQILWELF